MEWETAFFMIRKTRDPCVMEIRNHYLQPRAVPCQK